MGVTNNSLVRVDDVVKAGGVKNTFSSSVDGNKLIKDKDITKGTGTGSFVSPLFYNVTLKNEYEYCVYSGRWNWTRSCF